MKRMAFGLLLSCVLFVCKIFGATEYVVANNNNLNNNTLTVYKLDTSSGAFTQIAVLQTGGDGLGTVFPLFNYSEVQQAISPGAACVFALDARSQDIASFSKASGYALVGNYTNAALNPTGGGSLALTPNGMFLYATYGSTNNIGAWQVNVDCSLTFVGSYSPSGAAGVGALKVAPNGNSLIVALTGTDVSAEMYSIDRGSGVLASLGVLAGFCGDNGTDCLPQGLDITKDSKFVIFAVPVNGFAIFPYAVVARITPNGLTSPSFWSLNNSSLIADPTSAFLGATAYAGSGDLYFGMYNGVVTTNFTENPIQIKVTGSTIIQGPKENGNIAVTGQWVIVAEYPNQIGVYKVNSDGSLTENSTTTISGVNPGMISVSTFPETR